jgi:YfiH family protein
VATGGGGTDGSQEDRQPDFGLQGRSSAWSVLASYEELARLLGLAAAAVARQVHGTRVVCFDEPPACGVHVPGEADGLACCTPGLLLAVTAADCVPVYILDPHTRAMALLHAGWRGVAAGVLARGVGALESAFGARARSLRLHLGPAICRDCYEVGGDVVDALGGQRARDGRVDLRAELADQAVRLGARPEHIARSTLCTRCGPEDLPSHRVSGPGAGRMVAYLGWRLA